MLQLYIMQKSLQILGTAKWQLLAALLDTDKCIDNFPYIVRYLFTDDLQNVKKSVRTVMKRKRHTDVQSIMQTICIFADRQQTDRQTDKQTDRQTHIQFTSLRKVVESLASSCNHSGSNKLLKIRSMHGCDII